MIQLSFKTTRNW